MRRKTFKLMLMGEKNKICEVESVDYDEDFKLVRYRDAIYDWETGLWIVNTDYIKRGVATWRWYEKISDCSAATIMNIVKENQDFIDKINHCRSRCTYPCINPIEKSTTLFDL